MFNLLTLRQDTVIYKCVELIAQHTPGVTELDAYEKGLEIPVDLSPKAKPN